MCSSEELRQTTSSDVTGKLDRHTFLKAPANVTIPAAVGELDQSESFPCISLDYILMREWCVDHCDRKSRSMWFLLFPKSIILIAGTGRFRYVPSCSFPCKNHD